MMVWISVESVVISPLSFFIASIWFFSLFFFINLAGGLFCWSFQKTSSWIYCFFWRVFCVSISFRSALTLVISCVVLAFEFFLSSSSRSFNFDDRVSFLDLSLLLMWAFIAINFPLNTALNVSQILVCCVFILVGLKELLYFCLHFIVYPVNIQEPVVQFLWSCAALS